MRTIIGMTLGLAIAVLAAGTMAKGGQRMPTETSEQRDARMQWWRDARFGMFIHWGLYSIPAGEWKGQTNHAEWIRHTAQIPVEEYDEFVRRFNPVKFDADEWVRIAKDAGMKYIVITSKHHDGFCLFDSAYTDYDIMSTPFKRDIMRELADACRREGLKICWYHSIMDWHHPDYLPRRGWETRSAEGADFGRFVIHLKNQVKELVTNYGPIGVMWFDGEWEDTWTHEHGLDLYAYVRGLDPEIIVNNRVDKGRAGMAGMTRGDEYAGDFGTPEQEIPATGLRGVDWESCITMNNHWGYNKFDDNWKSSQDLIRKLVDIASKGGNFLLNVGPTAEGTSPQPCVDRLRDIGEWLAVNGESVYGTTPSPFRDLPWGRCTWRIRKPGSRAPGSKLYFHVFDWPADGKLVIHGLVNKPIIVRTLDSPPVVLDFHRDEDAVVIDVGPEPRNPYTTVVVVDSVTAPCVVEPPEILAPADIFVDSLEVVVTSDPISDGRRGVVRYTTDGSKPTRDSPVATGPLLLGETVTLAARVFYGGQPLSDVIKQTLTKVLPRRPTDLKQPTSGLEYEYYEGDWDRLPDFDSLTAKKTGTVADFHLGVRDRVEHFGFRYTGFVVVPRDGVYTFSTNSDDGSRFYIGDDLVVDNDGLHVAQERSGQIALSEGAHPITVTFFEKTGDDKLDVSYSGPGIQRQRIPGEALMRPPRAQPEAGDADALDGPLATPAQEQLEWHDCEIGMFIHFAPNTWMDKEYDDLSLPLSEFNPEKLDTDQWVAAAEAMGAKYIVFVAKHAGGFCMWQTDTTDYGVKDTPWRGGKGDVLADLAESCRKKGMRLGVYLSPQDKNHGAAGGGRCETEEAQERYNELYRAQITEVLSRYGEMFEVWFDGSNVVPVGDILSEYAPNAMVFQGPHATIRWVGNEDGVAPYPAWNSVSEADASSGVATAKNSDPDGTFWLPNECDARMRNTWFWRSDNAHALKTIDELMEMYYRSVGHGAVLLLNHTPDPSGLIPDADLKRGAEFGAEVKRRFGKSIAETSGKGDLVELGLEEPTIIDHIITMEGIGEGERVREYVVEGLVDGEWRHLCQGTAIGHKKIDRFAPTRVSKVRLRILRSAGEPLIRKFAVHSVSGE